MRFLATHRADRVTARIPISQTRQNPRKLRDLLTAATRFRTRPHGYPCWLYALYKACMPLLGDSKQHTLPGFPRFPGHQHFTFTRQPSFPPEIPPLLIIEVLRNSAIKDLPTKQVNHVAEGDEGNLLQGDAQQEVDLFLWGWGSSFLVLPSFSLALGALVPLSPS